MRAWRRAAQRGGWRAYGGPGDGSAARASAEAGGKVVKVTAAHAIDWYSGPKATTLTGASVHLLQQLPTFFASPAAALYRANTAIVAAPHLLQG